MTVSDAIRRLRRVKLADLVFFAVAIFSLGSLGAVMLIEWVLHH